MGNKEKKGEKVAKLRDYSYLYLCTKLTKVAFLLEKWKRLSHFATTSSSYFAMIRLDFRRLSLGRTAKWIQWLPELLRSM